MKNANEITSTELQFLAVAQMTHARSWVGMPSSDDDFDYAASAYELAAMMIRLAYDDDVPAFVAMCLDRTSPDYINDNYACDGVCDEIAQYLPDDYE